MMINIYKLFTLYMQMHTIMRERNNIYIYYSSLGCKYCIFMSYQVQSSYKCLITFQVLKWENSVSKNSGKNGWKWKYLRNGWWKSLMNLVKPILNIADVILMQNTQTLKDMNHQRNTRDPFPLQHRILILDHNKVIMLCI